MRFPGGKESTCQCRRCRRHGFDSWMGKIPRRRKWQPTLILLPGKSRGQWRLVGYSLWGHKESDTTEYPRTHTHIAVHSKLKRDINWGNTESKAFVIVSMHHYLICSIVIKGRNKSTSQTLFAGDRDYGIRTIIQNTANNREFKISPVYPFTEMIHSQTCKINRQMPAIHLRLFKIMFLLFNVLL